MGAGYLVQSGKGRWRQGGPRGAIDSPDEAMKFWSSQSFFIRCRAMAGVGGILLNIDSDSVGL